MKEKREIKQEKIYDKNNKLLYTIIPNYRKTDYFMSQNEIKFYKFLISTVKKIQEQYNLKLNVFTQVAINRIIKQNNEREKELEKDIFAKSIDFVLYDIIKDEIYCCIELDGDEHKTDLNRIERDQTLDNIFRQVNIKLIHQKNQFNYSQEDFIKKILEKEG